MGALLTAAGCFAGGAALLFFGWYLGRDRRDQTAEGEGRRLIRASYEYPLFLLLVLTVGYNACVWLVSYAVYGSTLYDDFPSVMRILMRFVMPTAGCLLVAWTILEIVRRTHFRRWKMRFDTDCFRRGDWLRFDLLAGGRRISGREVRLRLVWCDQTWTRGGWQHQYGKMQPAGGEIIVDEREGRSLGGRLRVDEAGLPSTDEAQRRRIRAFVLLTHRKILTCLFELPLEGTGEEAHA